MTRVWNIVTGAGAIVVNPVIFDVESLVVVAYGPWIVKVVEITSFNVDVVSFACGIMVDIEVMVLVRVVNW